jgi:hypothetical protein
MAAAYRWLVAEVAQSGVPTRGRPPVWAWHTVEGRRSPPDFRSWWSHEPQELITFDAPDELVVLTDYDLWHCVLNRSYISVDEAEDARFRALTLARAEREARIRRSWQHVFNLSFGCPDWHSKHERRSVQACVPFFDAAWIRSVRTLKGRRSARCGIVGPPS